MNGVGEIIASGAADPTTVITRRERPLSAIGAHQAFDRREPGWTKAALES